MIFTEGWHVTEDEDGLHVHGTAVRRVNGKYAGSGWSARPQNGCCSSRSRPSSRAWRVTGAAPWPAGSWAPAWRGAPIVPRWRQRRRDRPRRHPGGRLGCLDHCPGPSHEHRRPDRSGRPSSVRPLACGADLRRWIRAHGTGGPLVLGLDASHRRADIVLVRMRVRQRGAALPVAPPTPFHG